MPTFNSMPTEITTLLVTQLETDEFFNFRLICKDLYSKLSRYFLNCYFKTRYYILNCYSLHNLLKVSAYPVFSLSLRTLEICVDHLIKDIPSHYLSTWDNPGDFKLRRESSIKAIINKEVYKCYLED
jgi:hypothetical protein